MRRPPGLLRCRPAVEPLEDRNLLATFGVPWLDPAHLTLSFAPDGTAIAGHTSDLFQSLGAGMTEDAWQREVLRAFQTWAVNANISLGIVDDGGQAFGTAGPTHGDPRFGDLRIGGQAMSSEVLSVSVPHDPALPGTLAGDVFFNTAQTFTQTQLFAIALHEAGHVFGLDHSSDPSSVMFSHLNENTTLTGGDVAALQALYGTRAPDANEGSNGNNTLARATQLALTDGTIPAVAFGDVTTPTDVDFFKLAVPSDYSGPVTFRLQTAGVSLLEPRLTLYDANGNQLATASSTKISGDVLTLTLSHVTPGQSYFARVEAATSDVFGVGRYGLAASLDDRLTTTPAQLDAILRGPYDGLGASDLQALFRDPTHAKVNGDQHTDDDLGGAQTLLTPPGFVDQTFYRTVASLADGTDVDTYRIKAPNVGSGQTVVLTVTLRGVGGAAPHVEVFDSDGNPFAFKVLANGNGTFTIQASGIGSGRNVYLRVFAPPHAEPGSVGNYALEASFGRVASSPETLGTGSFPTAGLRDTYRLYVAQSQLFSFLLAAGPAATGAVKVELVNSAGQVVQTLTAPAGETVSEASLLLAPGEYTIRVTSITDSAGGFSPLDYTLQGSRLSIPIGPVLDDPTLQTQFQSPTDPTLFLYPGNVTTSAPTLVAVVSVKQPVSPPAPPPAAAAVAAPQPVAIFTGPVRHRKRHRRLVKKRPHR